MTDYRLSDRADGDLFEIYLYGIEQFGLRQADLYRREMDDCFAMLARHPHIGRSAARIAPGIRRHEHGSHVILYREEDDGILIVAVVHGASVRRFRVQPCRCLDI